MNPDTTAHFSRPLIIRLRNFIGDVVLMIPALERLATAGYPLQLLGKPWARSLFEAYHWPVTNYSGQFRERVATLRSVAALLRKADSGFDHRINAITFATSFSSALDMRMAGLRSFGYAVDGRSLLLRQRAKIVYGEHAMESYWRLAGAFLNDSAPPPDRVNLRISATAYANADASLTAAGIRPGYIVLVPFAGGTFEKLDKKWPHFVALGKLLETTGRDLVLAPAPNEMDIATQLFPRAKLLPKLDLGPYSAVLQRAALTIANDTGPGHMAASVGGVLLSVLGPTKIEQWGARGPGLHVIQQYPEWPSVDSVSEKALTLLAAH